MQSLSLDQKLHNLFESMRLLGFDITGMRYAEALKFRAAIFELTGLHAVPVLHEQIPKASYTKLSAPGGVLTRTSAKSYEKRYGASGPHRRPGAVC